MCQGEYKKENTMGLGQCQGTVTEACVSQAGAVTVFLRGQKLTQ